MSKNSVYLILAFHNHQPVGNFENVFREAFEKCYEPFVHFLEENPSFRVSLHNSGCLLDWFEAREKQFLKRLERLVKAGQVEMLSGGYYEPILPLIPERDALGQLRFMNQYLEHRFGKKPQGFWLTERVWEQKLPRIVNQAGLRYTAVDDTHFALAGLADSEIRDFFITEEEGLPLYLFPIPKFLRYVIPFREPVEAIEYLRKLAPADQAEPAVATYADDGEKFGLWPGTYQWVYRDGWLKRFAQALEENKSWISLKTFSEVLGELRDRPVKKVYLPTTSYEEMTEWALSREKAREFSKLRAELEGGGVWSRARVFFQGGIFKNFLTKYPESDWMRSKMEWVSGRVEKIKSPEVKKKAQQELWQAQCNCPYWHGVFGGLYLHHLRRSTYEHLIRSEKLCNSVPEEEYPRLIEEDLNQDGQKELVLESPPFSFYFLPHRGGSLAELDFHTFPMNLLDVVTRREESYHRQLLEQKGAKEKGGRSIHEVEKTVPPEVLEKMAFDLYQRFSCLDLFLPLETRFEDFSQGRFHSLTKDPTKIPFGKRWEKDKKGASLTLQGEVLLGLQARLALVKKIEIRSGESRFTFSWKLKNDSSEKIDCLWGNEWSFNFYDREREEKGTLQIEIQDGWSPVHLELKSKEAFDYWQFPIETIAQTEKDYRLMHQGIAIFPHWRLSLAKGEAIERRLEFGFASR